MSASVYLATRRHRRAGANAHDRVQAKRYLALAAFTGSFLIILAVIVLASF